MPGVPTRPDWAAGVDVEGLIAAVPTAATVMGLFFTAAVDRASREGAQPRRSGPFMAFKDYPLVEHIHVLVECARLTYPRENLRQGLRLLGRDAFSVFARSTIGWVLFGTGGQSWESATRLISRAYGLAGPVGSAEVLESSRQTLVVALRGIWNFADAYHVGIFEAALERFDKRGEVWLCVHSTADVDLHVRLE